MYFLKNMFLLAFSLPNLKHNPIPTRIPIDSRNSYLDSITNSKQKYQEKNYLESLEKPRHIPIRIKLPLIIKTNTTEQIFRNKKRSVSSAEGTFRIEQNDYNVSFSNVGGYSSVKSELIQIVDILKNKQNYHQFGVRLPKGVLLEGPTGNGKTLMARAFAGEIDFPIIPTSGAEFNEKYVGVGAARIRELFNFAEENQPCVIFIDEIDALARKRSSAEDGSSDERCQTLNQLLVALDGFNIKNDIIVLAATNRIDILDKAVIRPGRIDKIIHVPNPDSKTRKEIIEIHRNKKPINVTTEEIVQITNGLNGAQIENVLNEATLMAIRENQLPVNRTLLEETRNKIILGQSIGKKNLSESTLERVAIHEIGHLFLALDSKHFDKPTKVTIDSSIFSSIGYTLFEQKEEDQGYYLREYFDDHLKILLGGRIAEEIMYGSSVSSGAFSDLESAFQVAKKMIMEYGMGTHIIYPYFSENYKKIIDQEIHLLIQNAYEYAKNFLTRNKHLLIEYAKRLVKEKTLQEESFQEMVERFSS